MDGTSGPEFCEPFVTYDPESSCWRTLQATFLWGSDEYSATWPKSGMTRGGRAYELPTSAPAIDGSGCSSLPTPTARDGKSGMDYRDRSNGPDLLGALLPTPTAGQAGGTAEQNLARRASINRTSVTDLRMALQLLPTPTVQQGGSFDFGPFQPAVDRWAAVLGRPAPPGLDGRRLNPASTRRNGRLPDGWVTDVVPRRHALRILGNGVVPQQAEAAYRSLLGAP